MCRNVSKITFRIIQLFSLISTAVAKMTGVFWRSSIDVINQVVAAVSHLDVDGPYTTV